MAYQYDSLPQLTQNILKRLAKKLAFMLPLSQQFLIVPRSYGLDFSPADHEDFLPLIQSNDRHLGEASFAGLACSLPKETFDKLFLFSVFPNGNYEFAEIKKRIVRQVSDAIKVAAAICVLPLPGHHIAAYGISIVAIGKTVSDYNNSISGYISCDPEKDSVRSIEDNLIFKLIPQNVTVSFMLRASESSSSDVPSPLDQASALAEKQAAIYSQKKAV